MEYCPIDIESKWQNIWAEKEIFRYQGASSGKEKYYLLEMFPYPSGRLHMGHVRNYSIGDVVARYYLRNGRDVLHPIGWDAFGLPAENAAIEHKTAPAEWTYKNIESMKERFNQLGVSYDWSREIATCRPEYYRWEQLFFIEMYEKGLVYQKESEVNWCDDCNTVLANEQVVNGTCWRHEKPVYKKKIDQWYFKITEYAEELLADLETLDGWPDHVKEMQRNWIGRSEGTYIDFPFKDSDDVLSIFTTRPDTLMGVTFASIAVEHSLAAKIIEAAPNKPEMETFVAEVKKLHSEKKDDDDSFEKKGLFTGKYIVHPVTGEDVPLYFANFVLSGYGTGAVMAVPGHDQRDFEFAQKYDIPIKVVIKPKEGELEPPLKEAYTEPGVMINSDMFDGLDSVEGKKKVTAYLVEQKKGSVGINYRLRDWGISRQRYWGNPIPMIFCEKCGCVPEKKENLPVILPEDVRFSAADSPIKSMPEFYETTCPVCGEKAKRETDTMDTFVQSSWYQMKFLDPKSTDKPFDSDEVNHGMPVDHYIGGVEHAVMHLLYTRFFTKVLADLGYINFREPAKNLLTQGMVNMETYSTEDGYIYPEEVVFRDEKPFHKVNGKPVTIGRVEKMSKSKKNVVDPQVIIERYGADTARLFSLFAAPPEKEMEWSDEGIEGCYRFLMRIWGLAINNIELIKKHTGDVTSVKQGKDLLRKTHETIKRVVDDIKRFHFNTGVSAIMELLNATNKFKPENEEEEKVLVFAVRTMISLLNPFAPHMTEELHQMMGGEGLLSNAAFPTWNAEAMKSDEMLIVVQVNGKVRDKITVAADAQQSDIEAEIRSKDYSKYLKSGEIKKIIYVPKKLISVVG